MENFLFKKSYQLNTFLSLPYKSLWGANGIFTTIRLYGDSPELILLDEHLKKFNIRKINIASGYKSSVLKKYFSENSCNVSIKIHNSSDVDIIK